MMRLELDEIETKRLRLRPVELEDAADLFEVYNDARVVQGNTSMPPFESLDVMLDSIKNHFFAYRQRGVPQSMVLELRQTGVVIGIIDYHSVEDELGELGYMLAFKYWNQGYMKEALQAMVKIGFHQLGFHRIEAKVEPTNIASNKILQHTGFQKEGTLRQYMKLNDGQYHDLNIYSILKNEYQEEQK